MEQYLGTEHKNPLKLDCRHDVFLFFKRPEIPESRPRALT